MSSAPKRSYGASLDDYVDVAERIQDLMDAHPKASLQTIGWEVAEVGNQKFIVYRAAAYRHAEDPRPGMGIAWEPFPGRTPYTKDSELMNAETAAWGRAIVALGLVANRKLASRQEVRNRIEDQAAEEKPPAAAKKARKAPAPDVPQPEATGEVVPEIQSEALSGPNGQMVEHLKGLYQKSGWRLSDEEAEKSGRDPHDKLRWALLSAGVEDPAGPIEDAIRKLTVEGVLKLEASLKGEDDDIPGAGAKEE